MKSEIFSAYVAGLCPLALLMRDGPDDHRRVLPAPAGGEGSVELLRKPLRRKRTLVLVLAAALAIGAWQLLSRSDQTPATAVGAEVAVSGRSALLFVLIVGLTIGAGEVFSLIDGTRAAVPAGHPASHLSVQRA